MNTVNTARADLDAALDTAYDAARDAAYAAEADRALRRR
jgi:hypothetical protein